ncbi:hypothetical protein CHELA1G11_14412 [Hyphomicrobiales bacterium]|nr:hypothetical protein CHELA1G11_14412 [Hyphomicrobiales bacterium]CAH1680369.1 hypothetical protein CHELA1G2_14692 [Hyphomicrobiales bacterium]
MRGSFGPLGDIYPKCTMAVYGLLWAF